MGLGSKAGAACPALGHHHTWPVLRASRENEEEGFGKMSPFVSEKLEGKGKQGKENRARRKEEREDGREETKAPALKAPTLNLQRPECGGQGRQFTPSTAGRSVIANTCRLIRQRPRQGRGECHELAWLRPTWSPQAPPPQPPDPTWSPQTPP